MHIGKLVSSLLMVTWSCTARALLPRDQNAVPQIDGAPVSMSQNATGTYPRATNADANGLMIGAYNFKTANQTVLKTAKSTDSGQTWNDLGEVFRAETSTNDLGNEFPIFLPSGRLLYFYRNHSRLSFGNFTEFRIQVSYSDDGGVTFQYLSTVEERTPKDRNGIWEPFVRFAADGKTLQCYYSSEKSKADQEIIVKTSADGGTSWSDARIVSSKKNSRDGMPGVAALDTTGGNGKLIAVFETNDNHGRFVVSSVTSSDDGHTWGNRRRVYTPSGSETNAGAPQVVNVAGSLVVSFNTDEDKTNPSATARYTDGAVKVIVSTDHGKKWGHKTTIFASGANWPGAALGSNGEVLVMAGVNGQGVLTEGLTLS